MTQSGDDPATAFHGFEQFRNGRLTLLVAPEFREAMLASNLWGRLRHPGRRLPVGMSGRGELAVVNLAGQRCRVRHSWRGGWFGRLWGDLSLGPRRFLDELAMVQRTQPLGIRTPEIVALVLQRVAGLWFRGDTYLKEIPSGRDLRLTLQPEEVHDRAEVSAILVAVGKAVRSLHDAGFIHADLNAGNILIREAEVFFLDLGGSRFVPEISDAERRYNLFRLLRSFAKLGLSPSVVTPDHQRQMLDTYYDQVPVLDWNPKEFLAEMQRHVTRHRWLWRS